MESHRYRRPGSPPAGRRLVDPLRSSTGTVGGYSPHYDGGYYRPSRISRELHPSPRSSADRIYEPGRPIPRSYNPDSLQPPEPTGLYRRPRRQTLDHNDGRPVLVPPRSPVGASRPVVQHGRGASPPGRGYGSDAEGGSYYVTPASSTRNHRRNYSLDPDEIGQPARHSSLKERPYERPGYRGTTGGAQKAYHPTGALVRHPDGDESRRGYDAPAAYGYGYPEHQDDYHRDPAPPRRRRGDSIDAPRRERPISMIEMDRALPAATEPREAGPPPSTRGFDKIGKTSGRSGSMDRSSRKSGRSSSIDRAPRPPPDEIAYDYPVKSRDEEPLDSSGRPLRRRPAVLHQGYEEPYSPRRGEHDEYSEKDRPPRRYEKDEDRRYGARGDPHGSRESSADRHSSHDEDGHRRRRHRHHHRDHVDRDDREHRDKDREPSKREHREKSDRDTEREREREAVKTIEGRDKARPREYVERDHRERDRERDRRERDREVDDKEPRHRDRDDVDRDVRRRDTRDGRDEPRGDSHHELAIVGADVQERGRPRDDDDTGHPHDRPERSTNRVRVVSPPGEKESKAPIKGILRQPREKFPEDPAPIREGVAPLKDKDGEKNNSIPAKAKWTKIARKLVSPAALEEGNERFEVRDDHVVVLRVLKREDIEAYAARSQQIRDRDRERDRDRDRDRNHRREIEAPPPEAAPPAIMDVPPSRKHGGPSPVGGEDYRAPEPHHSIPQPQQAPPLQMPPHPQSQGQGAPPPPHQFLQQPILQSPQGMSMPMPPGMGGMGMDPHASGEGLPPQGGASYGRENP
ncbi:MAG: hypothetical protein M4579_004186 [Chaenotheca gracillima]|nr:MAG: hypothetical protein M4579_004186 [Chaenotheca gracillima]